MSGPLIILILVFVILLSINVPISVSIAMAAFATIAAVGGLPTETVVAQRIATGIDSFSLLAIPFFILSGLLMGRGGIARRLINFANALLGHLPGGLGYVNVFTCMLFGAISGSSVAAVSSVGGFMIPEMNKKGYDREFNVAVTTTAATTGLLIPPSNIMIVYSLVTGGVSIAAMFMAGILPGVLFGLLLMVVSGIISGKKDYGKGEKSTPKQVLRSFLDAILSLLLIIIVLGGILKGIFTATEAAAIAVVYAFFLAVVLYREVKLKDIPEILLQCGITTSVVMLLIGASMAMSWIMAYQYIPQSVSAVLLGLSSNKYVILIIINLILLFVGMFMDMTPAILIFTPIFLPVAVELGLDPIHFGIIMIANLCIGLCTPPVGTCLFVGCGVGETSISRITKPLLPFFAAMVAGLVIITFVPALSLLIPKLLGLN